jgi:hypothetical protein
MLHGSFLCESWAMTVAAAPGCWRSDMVDARAPSVARQSLFPNPANTSGVMVLMNGWSTGNASPLRLVSVVQPTDSASGAPLVVEERRAS